MLFACVVVLYGLQYQLGVRCKVGVYECFLLREKILAPPIEITLKFNTCIDPCEPQGCVGYPCQMLVR